VKKNIKYIIIILVVVIIGMCFISHKENYQEIKLEPITIAWSPFESLAPIFVAQDMGFFKQNGLDIKLHKYDVGLDALNGVIKGEADISVVAEFPLVAKAFQKTPIKIIGIEEESQSFYLIGRKDKGINQISDLKGKKIGNWTGTITDFYLGRFLELNNINLEEVKPVSVEAQKGSIEAMINGSVDATMTDKMSTKTIENNLGVDNTIIWPVQGDRFVYSLLVVNNEWIAKNPKLVEKFIKSIEQTEEYIDQNPNQSKTIVEKWLNVDQSYMEEVWPQHRFKLSLDQPLILAMEDEARWMINKKLTDVKEVPNFLDYIYFDAMDNLKPEAVTITHE
jgi:NitT/TauT family transport system substrate-binding protein